MASIICQKNRRWIIQFFDPNGNRKTLRLGKVNRRIAEAVKVRVEHLVAAKISGHIPNDETTRWLAGLDEYLLKKLAAVELIPKRQFMRLQGFLEAYIHSRCDTKASTRLVYGHTKRNLIEYFGADKPLQDITPGDGDEWRLYLIGENLADNTVRRRCGIAKQFFTAAVRKGYINKNPFTDLKAAVRANTSRMYFISRTEAKAVLDACPNAQWRLLFALSRYGGLRCPSEHLTLKWSDIDWARNRITVHSPKTAHYPGKDSRQIPLYPELLPYLQEVFEQASPGKNNVITLNRRNGCNFRTQLNKIIHRAGLKPWPKLFQNLRSTRETELAGKYPLHVVCAWMGNSQPVAAKHYLQVTDDHFDWAVGVDNTLQNALQYPAASARIEKHKNLASVDKSVDCKDLRNSASWCEKAEKVGMGDTGLEPVTSRV